MYSTITFCLLLPQKDGLLEDLLVLVGVESCCDVTLICDSDFIGLVFSNESKKEF